MSTKHVRNRPSTPGRGAKSANQYFEPGLGRKTGIALKSTGARDEYGLEPVSGIFSSSPASSRRTTAYIIDDGSTGMEGLDSSAPDVEATLHARRTPGIPPARASTPRRSNITGSPQRHSSLKPKRKIFIESPSSSALRHPAAARILGIDDNSEIRQSIEKRTPKKRAQFDRGPVPAYANGVTPSPGTGGFRTNQIFHENEAELEEAYDLAGSILHNSSPLAAGKQRKGKTRRSIETSVTETALDPALAASTSRKRPRRSDVPVDDEPLFHQGDDEEEMFPPPKRQSLPAAEQYIDLQADDGYGDGGNQDYDDDDDVGEPFDEPVGDNGLPEGGASDDNVDVQEVEPRRKKTKQPRPKKDKAAPKVTNRARSVISDDDDAGSAGPSRRLGATVSNVRLRSTTPFEDAGHRTTRSGRAVMKPLNYWAGETVIWKNGEMDGIIRANSVEKVVEPIRRKPPPKTAKKKKKPNLADIDEQDEDLLPSDWEEEIGVLTGDVARFDYNTGIGNDEELVREDLAFAASSIVTKRVGDATFSYAKIQTLPYFGSGIVEIEPLGLKASKNSRKMQMNFFVHKGKVQVTISTPIVAHRPEPLESTTFTITEGGAWIVPRGNVYAIQNASSSTTAYLFFSQGCEVEASLQDFEASADS